MTMRSHTHKEVFAATPQALFELLHTPSAICRWWGTARAIVSAKKDGFWAAAWGEDEDSPDFLGCCDITVFDPPRKMVFANQQYAAKTGPLPFEADLSVTFEVAQEKDGASLTVTHEGFPTGPEADDYFDGCVKGWAATFDGIRRYLQER